MLPLTATDIHRIHNQTYTVQKRQTQIMYLPKFAIQMQWQWWWGLFLRYKAFELLALVMFEVWWSCCQNDWIMHLLNMKITIKLCCYVIRSTRSPEGSQQLPAGQSPPLTPQGRTGGPYHVTTQFYFYPVMSKIQNSINIHPWIWLAYRVQLKISETCNV